MKSGKKFNKSEKEKSLKETYTKLLEVGFGEGSLENIDQFIDDDVMGYGTAQDEKIMSLQEFRDLIIDQRKQSTTFDDFSFTSKPLIIRFSDNGNTAVVVDEFILLTRIKSESIELPFRMSTIFEFRDGVWKLIHWHGSKPEHFSGGDDPWHVDEWKKKNAELQKAIELKTADLVIKNRELEIESALEKVRTIAMGMRKPADMLDVCKTISLQLQSLGVMEIRNVQTAIFYEQRGTYMNYEFYAKHDKTIITETVFTNNEIHNEFAAKMLKGKGETFITHIKGDEVKDWIAYQKTTNVFIDKYLETASSLNYYWFSLGPVALGISTYISLTEDDINLFKRFLKVFELAYQRYLDIEKAEAQAREAKIEAALERVRSRTMAMQKSDELQDAAALMFQQIETLGVNIMGCGFNIWDEDKKEATAWMSGMQRFQPPFKTSSSEDIFLRIHKAAEKGDLLFVEEQAGDEVIKHYEYMASIPIFKKILDQLAETGGSAPSYQIMHCAFFTQGYLMFISLQPVVEAYDIFIRFAKVFEQTYTRFLDLQKAEAQAREAQIEAALEKVRGRTMAMQKSEELGEVAVLLYQQLISLGVTKFFNCGYVEVDEQNKVQYGWMTNPDGSQMESFKLPLVGEPAFEQRYNAWTRKDPIFHQIVGGDSLQRHIEFASPLFGSKEVEEMVKTKFPDPTIFYCGNFTYGYLHLISDSLLKPEEEALLVRFTRVFEMTYSRFLDLQKAEEQNKIIQAENERKSRELEEARELQLAMLPKELPKLSKLDVAVYMRTATEVGGDYYDFSTKENGSLNICLGDATGHGLKAGTLVSIMKSLFIADSVRLDIKQFFTSSNETLKKMSLSKMMIAFAMINIYGDEIKISNAGIPPVLIYRKEKNFVEEVNVHGLPIGAMRNVNYEVYTGEVNSGDTILLFSDGLPELQNINNEMYGYNRLKEIFVKNGNKNPDEIISVLENESRIWRGEREQEDDITFVVIKVK